MCVGVASLLLFFLSFSSIDPLELETKSSHLGVLEAGKLGPNFTCTVRLVDTETARFPSAHWLRYSLLETVSEDDTTITTRTTSNTTTAITAISFSSLLTSHAGLYTCEVNAMGSVASNSSPVTLTVKCKNYHSFVS